MAKCTSADSILEAAAQIKANGAKIDTFTNGTDTQTVQLGSGTATPVLRNLVRQMYTTAAQVENASVDGKFVLANGSSESRTLASRFADVINVKDFGAKGDGVTDDSAALQAALDRAHDLGGGVVFLPTGKYRKRGNTTTLKMYSNTVILGCGDASEIYYDTTESVSNPLLKMQPDCECFCFKNFKVSGTLIQYPTETNAVATIFGNYLKHVAADNVTFENLRFFAFTANQAEDVAVTNCRFLNILRDGVHCEDTVNVRITNNYFYRVCDDAISLCQIHSTWTDEKDRFSASFVILGNIFEICQGVQMSGVKGVTISHNIFTKSLRNPINIHYKDPSGGTVLFTGMFAFIVDSNIILDTIGNRGSKKINAISFICDSATASDAGNTESPEDVWNSFNTTEQTPFCVVKITNNIIGWTLPVNVAFSSYNRGEILDRAGSYENGGSLVHGFSDPIMDANSFRCNGIYIEGSVHSLDIKNNNIFGFKSNNVLYWAIFISLGEYTDKKLLCNCSIEGNKIHDWPATRAMQIINTYNKKVNSDIFIKNNFFDLDPYFRNTGHYSTNKWSGSDVCTAIYCGAGTDSGNFGEVTGNIFKNCSRTVQSSSLVVHDNAVFFTPASGTSGLDGREDNLGIYRVSLLHKDKHFIIDGDPESDSFSSIVSLPVLAASAMPTSGTFVRDDFVKNTGISTTMINGNTCRLLGWRRITTGSSHVLGTDWSAEYAIVYNG